MSGVQVLVLALCALNVGLALALADPMTWRTHPLGPQLRIMCCGVMTSVCGALAWYGVDLEFALCAQFVVLVVLLHSAERLSLCGPAVHWPDRRQPAEIRARGDHAQ